MRFSNGMNGVKRRRFLGMAAAAVAAYPLYRVGASIFGGDERFHAFGGQLARLKESLMKPGLTGICFIGDSITWGTGTRQGPNPNPRRGTLADPRDNFASESYVNNFKRYIGQTYAAGAEPVLSNWPSSPSGQSVVEYEAGGKKIRVSNQGINGASTFSYKAYNLVAGSPLNSAPLPDDRFVFLQLGTNDRIEYQRNPKDRAELTERIVDIVQGLSGAHEVILMCANPTTPKPNFVYLYEMDEVRAAVLAAAQQCGVDFIDNYAAFPADPDSLLADGLHPNVAGHRYISDNIQRALEIS